jgi:hypothetical protein
MPAMDGLPFSIVQALERDGTGETGLSRFVEESPGIGVAEQELTKEARFCLTL